MSGPIRLLSNLQSPVFLINSRLDLFAAPTSRWDPFSRSYGVNLPSSLTVIHSSTLGYSPRPPVSVYGTGDIYYNLEDFLGSILGCTIGLAVAAPYCRLSASANSSSAPIPTLFNHLFRQVATLTFLRLSIEVYVSIGILTDCPSRSPFGLPLGPD